MAKLPTRTLATLASVTVVTSALTGCATIATSDQVSSCEPTQKYAVERQGTGTGPVITDNGIATFTLQVVDDKGEVIVPQGPVYVGSDMQPAPGPVKALNDNGYGFITDIMRCAQAGQTVTGKVPVAEFVASQAQLPNNSAEGDVTITVEIDKVYHSSASGRVQPPQSGIPAVVTAPNGEPGVTMPDGPAPTERKSATTIAGFGSTVERGQVVTLQVTALSWQTGRVVTSTWQMSGPAMQVPVGPDDQLYGITEDLVGERVGSQRVIIVPGEAIHANPMGFERVIKPDDAAVFVVDVLGAE